MPAPELARGRSRHSTSPKAPWPRSPLEPSVKCRLQGRLAYYLATPGKREDHRIRHVTLNYGEALHLGESRRRATGQGTVEFALVVPILLMLFVAIADFGRVFAASIVIEAAARNAAEVAAQDYLRNPPGDPMLTAAQRLAVPAPNPGDPAYYDDLGLKAGRTACVETRNLPNTSYVAADGSCPEWPLIRVCVHDGVTAGNPCGNAISPGFQASTPSECDQVPPPGDAAWNPSKAGGGVAPGDEPSRYVEVRICYPFTAILNIPIMPSRIILQRTRIFTIACFQDPDTVVGNNGSC